MLFWQSKPSKNAFIRYKVHFLIHMNGNFGRPTCTQSILDKFLRPCRHRAAPIPDSFFFGFLSLSLSYYKFPRVGINFEFCPGSDLSAYSLRFPTAKGSLACATCTRDLRDFSSLSEKTRCEIWPTIRLVEWVQEKKKFSRTIMPAPSGNRTRVVCTGGAHRTPDQLAYPILVFLLLSL